MTTAIDDDATDGEDADGEGDYEIDLEVDDDDVVHSNICKVYMFVWLMSSGTILHAPFRTYHFMLILAGRVRAPILWGFPVDAETASGWPPTCTCPSAI